MLNIKLVYLFNEPESLCWTEKDNFGNNRFREVPLNPIKQIYINDVLYKRSQIKDEYKIDFLKLCKKMDKYLLKKESCFGKQDWDVIQAYNTYKYKEYKLINYERLDPLVAIELEVKS